MAGKSGMKMQPAINSQRQKMWQSMRILRRFTIAAILRTIPGDDITYANAQKFIRNLTKHNYVAKTGAYSGGRRGDAQEYILVNNTGPTVPVLGIGRSSRFLKETEKERETGTDQQTGGAV